MYRVRPAIMADAAAIAAIDVESWRTTYAGILPDTLLLGLGESQRRREWAHYAARHPGDVLVATDVAGRVRGFGSCGRAREGDGRFAGEVYTLYVAPDYQGRGLGRRLLLGLFARLLRRQLPSAVVWVLRDNPSRFFYARMGGRPVGHRELPVGGTAVPALAFGWPDLATLLKQQAGTGGGAPGDG